jgi:hypothetical protein
LLVHIIFNTFTYFGLFSRQSATLYLSFNSFTAFPSFSINCSSLRRCRRLLVLVTSFILSTHKLRILLKEMDNRRHNLLMNNKQYIVCTHRISGAENYRLTCCVSNIYNTSNTNFYYVHDSCTPRCVSLFLHSFCPPRCYNQFYQTTDKIYQFRMLSNSILRTQNFVNIGQFFQ